MKLSRRDFLKGSLAGAAALAVSAIPGVAYADKTGIGIWSTSIAITASSIP